MSRYTTQIQQSVFDQSILLHELQPSYAIRPTDYALISGGICYMLSMEWLRCLFETPDVYPASIFFNNFEDANNLMYFKQIANNYCKFSADYEYNYPILTTVSPYPSIADIPQSGGSIMEDVDRWYVSLCSNKKMQVVDCTYSDQVHALATRMTSLRPGCGMLLWLTVYESGTDANNHTYPGFAHEMALWRDKKGELYFFDPNEGVFTVKDAYTLAQEILSYANIPPFPIEYNPWIFISQVERAPTPAPKDPTEG